MAFDDEPPDNPLLADGYAAAAPLYWEKSWRGILPMPRGRKFPPPTNYTGYKAIEPSYADIEAWREGRPDGNIALYLPDGIIGIDVDAYEGKTGAGTLAYAEHLWGTLPSTARTTSRDDTHSGIRLYRVPDGTRLATKIEFPDLGLGHIEIIQASHRYAIVWPSLHPSGQKYQWLDDAGMAIDIPAATELPDLPQQWIDNLQPGSQVDGLDTVDIASEIAGLSAGAMDTEVATRLGRAALDLGAASSRHDTTCAHVLALLRLSEQGCTGVQEALAQLGDAFVVAVTKDGTRTEQQARSEFARMVYNERGHALIKASPTVVEVLRINSEAEKRPQADEGTGVDEDDPTPPRPARPASDIEIPDNEFWTALPFLTTIYEQAHHRLTSPWSVLGCCVARALATIPPWITLPPFIGGRGSLNAFIAIVGHSGQGKGSSEAVAELLVPLDPMIGQVPIGSGEGLAHSYVHRATPKEKDVAEVGGIVRDRISCLFSVPEVDTLTAVGGRQGATIMSKLRSAYSGEEIGFSYADPTKRLLVGKHEYRMTLILGVQAARARAILDDAAGGTPQRFVWMPATDPSVGSIEGRDHPPIDVAEWGSYRGDIDIPDIAKNVIRESHIARARGEGDALDGHALFTREKVMVAITALDGRKVPDEWDWMIAGQIMAKSDEVRSQITAELADAVRREAVARGEAMGIARAVGDDAAVSWKVARVSETILRALRRHGPSMSGKDALKAVASRDRNAYVEAMEQLESRGLIRLEQITYNGQEGHRVTLIEAQK